MSILRNRLLLSVLGLVLTTAVCVVYLFSAVLKAPLLGDLPEVTVELRTTGGLFKGSPASYRGVRVGTVTAVEVGEGGHVAATVQLRDGAQVPRSSLARVRSLSPVGEQFLDFEPETSAGPYLADGDVISAEATDVPVSLAKALDQVNGLVEVIDRSQLRVVLRELGGAVQGRGDDLEEIIVAADELSTDLDVAWPATERLLRNGESAGRLIAGHEDDLVAVSASARRLARFLKTYDPRFRKILARAPRDFDTIDTLVLDLEDLLPPLLAQLVDLTQLVWEREAHLRETTRALPFGLGRLADAVEGGTLRIDAFLHGNPEACEYGTERESPRAERRPTRTTGSCGATGGEPWRGADHAPPPIRGAGAGEPARTR